MLPGVGVSAVRISCVFYSKELLELRSNNSFFNDSLSLLLIFISLICAHASHHVVDNLTCGHLRLNKLDVRFLGSGRPFYISRGCSSSLLSLPPGDDGPFNLSHRGIF